MATSDNLADLSHVEIVVRKPASAKLAKMVFRSILVGVCLTPATCFLASCSGATIGLTDQVQSPGAAYRLARKPARPQLLTHQQRTGGLKSKETLGGFGIGLAARKWDLPTRRK